MQPGLENELEVEQQRLRRLASEALLDEFLSEANATLTRWENKPSEAYGRLAETIGDLLNSGLYSGDRRSQPASWRLAEDTIRRKSHTIPVLTLVRLLYHSASEPLSGRSDWPAVRSERARWWIEAWNRLYEAIDSNFNREDVPPLSADPAAKAKAEYYTHQSQLRQAEPHFKRTATAYLNQLYSLPPEQPEELKRLTTTLLG